ncbi:MAG: DUF917 domain-containing protein [Candidatus Bathyarchaeia archaeon]
MIELTKRNLESLLVGAEIMGCGGGGPPEWAANAISDILKRGRRFRLVDPKEVADDKLVVIVGRVGGGVSEDIEKKVAKLKKIYENPEYIAVKELSKYLGEEPYAFLPSEIGAGNTALPMCIAAMNDAVTIDGDACGRAKPEIAISTTHIRGLSATPLAIVSPFGDVMILKESVDDFRVEDICRQMAIASGGLCGVCRLPARGKDIKNAIVHNSISKAIAIGEAITESRKKKQDPVRAFIESSGGYELFKGIVESWTRTKAGAFMEGYITIKGVEKYFGQSMKIWYKNEFLISWLNGEPYVTCPDLICIVDSSTSRGLSNWIENIKDNVGKSVVVVGIKCADVWRTDKGIKLFGPEHFGFDIKYTPIEKLLNAKV